MKRSNAWTKEEYAILKKYYPSSINNTDLLKMLSKRSFSSIKTKARNFKLKRGKYLEYRTYDDKPLRKWTLEEIEILKDYYNLLEDKKLLELLPGRTIMGMKHIARKLKLGSKEVPFMTGEPWSMTEDNFLIDNFPKISNKELMSFLKSRTLVAIKARAQKLGLKRDKNVWASVGSYQPWTAEENNILIKNWDTANIDKLPDLLKGRSIEGIKKQAKKIGIFSGKLKRG